ncbi:MAG: HAMP domain-containing sensor histidine kinase [bacterium]
MEQSETARRQESRITFEFDERPEYHLSEQIAHRLRNPLTTIMSCCSQLIASDETEFSESDHKFLEWIAEAAEQQEETIKRFVRAFGPLHAAPRVCDLAQAALRVSKLLKPDEHTRLIVALPPQELKAVADYDLIHELLGELLNNAIEAKSTEIRITAGVAGGQVWLRIANLPTVDRANWQARYGEPFFTTKPGHSGLGAKIAHRLADLLGGSIKLDKQDDEVAVTLSLPHSDTGDSSPEKGLWYAEDSDS